MNSLDEEGKEGTKKEECGKKGQGDLVMRPAVGKEPCWAESPNRSTLVG